MQTHQASASAQIQAPAEDVYAIIADYRDGHPHILPKPPFLFLEVEQGGVGAGTVVHFQMRLLGQTKTFHARVVEPEPGRVLVETDVDTGQATTFTVELVAGGQGTVVTITTEVRTRDGVPGAVEGFLAKKILQPVYVRELKLLAALAGQRAAVSHKNAPAHL